MEVIFVFDMVTEIWISFYTHNDFNVEINFHYTV